MLLVETVEALSKIVDKQQKMLDNLSKIVEIQDKQIDILYNHCIKQNKQINCDHPDKCYACDKILFCDYYKEKKVK